ncbi:MAG: hypothetical protein PHR00_01560 [Patescibacteria group bacterium]|nr:hypothetical protein [Patescibacteria group bacterium]
MDGFIKYPLWAIGGFIILTLLFSGGLNISISSVMASDSASVKGLTTIQKEASAIYKSGNDLNGFLMFNKVKKDLAAQKKGMKIYIDSLVKNGEKITVNEKYAMNNFIVYGTPSTSIYIQDQRFLMIKKYKEYNDSLPKTEDNWNLLLKSIAVR